MVKAKKMIKEELMCPYCGKKEEITKVQKDLGMAIMLCKCGCMYSVIDEHKYKHEIHIVKLKGGKD